MSEEGRWMRAAGALCIVLLIVWLVGVWLGN